VAGGAGQAGRSVASKVTAILMVFTRGSSYSLTELARLADLPVSTAHRLAGELTSRRLLERTPDGGYRIGLSLRVIAASPAGLMPPRLERARGIMMDLAAATGTTARLGVLDGRQVAYVETPASGGPLPWSFAATLPANATALGRALLAFSPAAVVDEVASGLPGDDAHLWVTPERLRRALAVIRLTRVATCRAEQGSVAVAMPVFGAGGAVVAALELTVPDTAEDLVRGRAALLVATGSLSRQLATLDAEPPDTATG